VSAERRNPVPAAVLRPAGFVIKAPGFGYFVASRTEPGTWWFVNGSDCSCPADPSRRGCWHVRQTVAYEQAMTVARPSAPANVSALVD
jgi:hypothetical protein